MSKKILQAAAGAAGGESVYVEDVFSTYLYEGASTPQTITNGIDLSGEGGMVWIKCRDNAYDNFVFDTERTNKHLHTNKTDQEIYDSGNYIDYNSDGFDVEASGGLIGGPYSFNYASWTFRKQAGFFDVVTYTGTGSSKTISHNLGSTPGFIITKKTSGTGNWICLDVGTGKFGYLDLTNGLGTGTIEEYFGNDSAYVAPTSSSFTIGSNANMNVSGETYVAYLFAHDDQSFGDNSDESIIKCGSFTTNSLGNFTAVDLGWEPQWLLIKRQDASGNWYMHDVFRGIGVPQIAPRSFRANTNAAESSEATVAINSQGIISYGNYQLDSSATYIYIAIRRPMKTPEAGTDVFKPVTYTGTGAAASIDSGFPVDLYIGQRRTPASVYFNFRDRLRGKNQTLQLPTTSSEYSNTSIVCNFDDMDGVNYTGLNLDIPPNSSGESDLVWMFKRATGFMDVVAYEGDGVAGSTQAHNLGVAPEMIIVKRRDSTANWQTYHSAIGATGYLTLDLSNAATTSSTRWNDTEPTSTEFTLAASGGVNNSGGSFIAYLFATVAGVSKVGSYTGTGNSLDINCGFSSGARFVLIKRTDSTSDWWVWDSARGIVAGNDPTLRLNSTAAETTTADYIDPLSSGFTLTTAGNWLYGMNYPSGEYIFLAIA